MNHIVSTFILLAKRTVHEFSEDNCTHMAAAVSYYVLFSIVPLAVLLVSIFGFVVRDEDRQQQVTDKVVSFLDVDRGDLTIDLRDVSLIERYGINGLREIEGALEAMPGERVQELAAALDDGEPVAVAARTVTPQDVTLGRDNLIAETVEGVSAASGALGIVGLIGIAWSASAMFGAIRKSLNIAWDTDVHRPVVQQKLIDLASVFGLGLLLALSIAGTTTLRVFREISDDALGPLSTGTGFFWSVLPLMLPAIFTFLVFLLVYRFVPNVRTGFSEVWPGALLATVLFELLKNGYALYVANFSNYNDSSNVLYGSLGAILLFMLWAYLAATILLLGAEVASEYPRVLRGDYASAEREAAAPSRSRLDSMVRMLRGLVLHDRQPVEQDSPADVETRR